METFDQLLTYDAQPGTLRFGGARMALLDVEAGFWGLRRQLEALVGRRLTNTVLQQAGANGGASFARAFAPDATPETAAAALRDCIAAYEAAGFGAFRVTELTWPLGRVVVQADGSFEAWAAQQHLQASSQPECAYSAGVLVGFVNALANRHDIVCIERACQAQGADACLFELLPAAAAGETAVVSFDPDPFLSNQLNLLELLFDRMPMGIAIIDRAYRLRRFNPTFASFIERYTPTPASRVAPGAHLFDLEPGTEETLQALFAPVFAGETVRREAVRLESAGIVSYWDVVLVPLLQEGEVVALLDVSLDATERVHDQQTLLQTFEALQRSEASLRSMLESARGYAIYRVAVDPTDPYLGKVLLVSPSIRDVLGVDDPYQFASWFAGIHPDERERVLAANRRALELGAPFDETMRFYHPRRQAWRWVHTVSHPIFAEDGRVTHFTGLTIDVTDQKEAADTLAQLNVVLEREVAARTREIDRRRQVAESLRDILRVLNSSRPLPEVLAYIARQASQLMAASICTLHHIDHQQAFVRIEASYGLPPVLRDIPGFPLMSSAADQRILNRQPVVFSAAEPPALDPAREAALDPRVRRWRAQLVQAYPAYLAVPLVVADELYGSLAFYFSTPRPFSDETVELAQSLADQAALAIENAWLRDQVQQAAATTERNRLARELHDAVTQTLFSASLIADVLPRLWQRDPVVGEAKLAELRELTRGALAEMRTLLLELRPATLTESSLGELLQQLAAAFVGRARLAVEVEVAGDRPLSPDAQVTLYRIAQEALNNVVKHAGATRVTIRLAFEADCITLLVSDDGRGFDPASAGVQSLGLGIMRERAAKLGADLRIESVIGEGTAVWVRICETEAMRPE